MADEPLGTPGRSIRRKSSSTKRLSPAPSTQTSYYSESVMSESYLGGSRGLAALGSSILDDALDSSMYWGEPSLPGHRGGGEAPQAGWLARLPPAGLWGVFFREILCFGGRWGALHQEEKRHRGHRVQ